MSGAYPHFKLSYTHEELVEHFLLTPADLQLVWTCRGETNLCGMALLLKALTHTWPRPPLHEWGIPPTREGSPSVVPPCVAHCLMASNSAKVDRLNV